jgi:hypothetical protein
VEETTFQEIVDKIKSNNITGIKSKRRTDDQLFAQSEISEINHKLEKAKMREIKFWLKSSQTPREMNIRKKILEIKKNIQEKASGNSSLANIPNMNEFTKLTSEGSLTIGKHFNNRHLEMISDSARILKEKSLQNNRIVIPGKMDSLHNFMIDNREISLKNYIIDLLKTEAKKIETREEEVSKALKDSNVKLDLDYKRFDEFTDAERGKQRKLEKIFAESMKENRDLADKEKKLKQENKQILDELERTVKAIKTYRSDAVFVHSVLKDPNKTKFSIDQSFTSKKTLDYEGNFKDADYPKMAEDLIKEFSYLEKENRNEIPDILKDHTRMIQNFTELEENILKLLDSHQNYEKENDKLQLENNKVLKELETREKQMLAEKDKLLLEKVKEEKLIKELQKTTLGEASNSQINEFLRELYCTTVYREDYEEISKNKKLKGKSLSDIEELMDKLREIEETVIINIENMNKIFSNDPERFRKIITFRKEFNKIKKQEDLKKKAAILDRKKKKKAEERMHRIVVKGRNPMEHYVNKAEKKKSIVEKSMSEDEEY